jgi:beta-glucosidase
LRHVFDVNPTDYDLWDTYLPAFKELVTNAHVAGVMCAYNAFKTQPCCGSDELMIQVLRNQWKFTGYVTSDCWGIEDFFKNHKTSANAEDASADAVFHGTDVECGTNAYLALVQAVKDGKINEEQINTSVKRLFMIRMRLGMFDPPSVVKYAQTPANVLESPSHKAHALKMARESIVLLKNDNHILPLNKSIKKIAVLGPNANNAIAVLGNYNGTPSEIVTALDGIKKKLGNNAEIVYEQAINFTNDTLLAYTDVSDQYSINGKPGFKAEYFSAKDLSGEAIITTENNIDHSWQEGAQVIGNIKANNFSARYTTSFTAAKDGDITFEVEADDGYKFLVNDAPVINARERNRWGARTYKLNIKKNSVYKLVLEYWQGEGKANVRLRSGNYVKTDFTTIANKIIDADAIVFVGGISPQLEGEEMPVNYPGFNGGDRTSIMLPAVQTTLLKTLKATGKPVVFVMMTGSAIATPWESENIPAIINAWYGGQSAGTAIADVLFGDYNPSGRLPVTFYKSDNDLPAFEDYSMNNRTYRYFKGEALYPFGYGLSYTTFKYEGLKLPVSIKSKTNIPVSINVTNTGKLDGDEVVELYISYKEQRVKVPAKALKGFQRVSLKAGESRNIQFMLNTDELAVAGEDGTMIYPKGKLVISVGGGQPGIHMQATSNVVEGTVLIY